MTVYVAMLFRRDADSLLAGVFCTLEAAVAVLADAAGGPTEVIENHGECYVNDWRGVDVGVVRKTTIGERVKWYGAD